MVHWLQVQPRASYGPGVLHAMNGMVSTHVKTMCMSRHMFLHRPPPPPFPRPGMS
jgi:hypothetical protein